MSGYRKTIVKVGVVLAFALAFAVTTPTKAEAAVIAYICDDPLCVGGGDVIVVDESADDAASGVLGVVVATGINVGGFEFTLNTATSKPGLEEPAMDLNFVALNTTGTGHAWLYASETDFTVVSPLVGTIDGNSSSSGSITASIYGGCTNFPSLCDPVSTGPLATPGSFHAELVHPAATVNPYAYVIGVEIIATSAGITTGDLLVVPEPASIVLLGMGLIGAGAASRRRRRKA